MGTFIGVHANLELPNTASLDEETKVEIVAVTKKLNVERPVFRAATPFRNKRYIALYNNIKNYVKIQGQANQSSWQKMEGSEKALSYCRQKASDTNR